MTVSDADLAGFLYRDESGIFHFVVDNDRNLAAGDLEVFVIFDRTTGDYPGEHVVRRSVSRAGRVDMDRLPLYHGRSLKQARAVVPAGKVKMSDENPKILEVWM